MTHTIASAAAALRSGKLTSAVLVDQSLAAIAEHGARTNAFIRVDRDAAREQAKRVDDERARGIDRGPLHGIPISLKDLIDVAGQPTTAASNVRKNHIATRDARVVERLREAGAIFIGKTNLHEFALGTTSDETAYGAVHNPHDVSRSAGGSSGGSAAAVATGMGLASIGSDTGGSIRIPAAACGIVGLKPSLGDVPLDGVVPLCATFDHVGPLTRSVEDAALLWTVLSGRGAPTTKPRAANTLHLAALGGYFTELLQREVRAAFTAALSKLKSAGARMNARTVQGTESITDTYINISLPEAAQWHGANLDEHASEYTPAVHARFLRGRTIPAVAYFAAREDRVRLMRAVDAALEGYDALLLPSLAILAPPLGASDVAMDNGASVNVRMAMLRLTQLFNMTGHPAISIPIATAGLPAGLQLVGRRDATVELLGVALACERALTG